MRRPNLQRDAKDYASIVKRIKLLRGAISSFSAKGLQYSGQDDLPKRAIVACNHISRYEAPILMDVLSEFGRSIYFLSKRRMMWVPSSRVNRTFMEEDDKISRENMRDLEGAIDSGYLIGIFPEGKIGRKEKVGDIQDGIFRISARLGAQIVPCGVNYKGNGKIPFYSDNVQVHFGEVFDFNPREFDKRRIRLESSELCYRLKTTIQDCYDEAD